MPSYADFKPLPPKRQLATPTDLRVLLRAFVTGLCLSFVWYMVYNRHIRVCIGVQIRGPYLLKAHGLDCRAELLFRDRDPELRREVSFVLPRVDRGAAGCKKGLRFV